MATVTMDMLLSQDYRITGARLSCAPNSLYAAARNRARRGQFWSSLTGRSQSLLSLKQITAVCAIESKCDGGIHTVPVSQIRGSEGRSRYFDADFNPRYDQARGRWLSIARVRQQGKNLPPVVLVQVGDVYFVRDGHHRISVARALGQTDVEARVTVWQVAGPVSWEMFAKPPRLRCFVYRALSEGGRLWARAKQGVQAFRDVEKAAQGC